MTTPPADPLKLLPIITMALFSGSLMLLGTGFFVQRSRQPEPGLEVLVWVAGAWCVMAPFVAGKLAMSARRQGVGAPLSDAEKMKLFQLTVVSFAILESAVLLCTVALIVQPTTWPLFLALIPLGTMILALPRAR